VPPLRGSSFFCLADPALTHWANFCRASSAGPENIVSASYGIKNENWLHRDGIFGVACDVPAGIALCVGEDCAGAGNVFFGSDRVDLVFRFVALIGNCEKADAMDGRVGGAQARNRDPDVVPGKIKRVGDEEQNRKSRDEADNQARAW